MSTLLRSALVLGCSLALGWIAVPPPASAAPSQTSCSALTTDFKAATKRKKIRKRARTGKPTVLTSVWQPAASGVPEHCLVSGYVDTGDKRVGLNRVNFRAELPTGWNAKLHFSGNSGFSGALPPVASRELSRGYATAVTDTGHQSAGTDASWAQGQAAKRIDFLDRGVHAATVGVKQVLLRYYGSAVTRAYFEGCSTGGRQGLWEAMQYPGDFDGVIAGAPADLAAAMASFAWNQRHMYPDPTRLNAPALPSAKLAALEQHVLASCDALDGIVDRILDDPRECTFDPRRDLPVCAPGNAADPSCFTTAQIDVIAAIYAGPGGRHRALGYSKGGESDSSNWRNWMVSSSAPGQFPSMQHVMIDSFFRGFVSPTMDFRSFDPANGDFGLPEPAGFSANQDLRAFQQRGGKLILWHGCGTPRSPRAPRSTRSRRSACGSAPRRATTSCACTWRRAATTAATAAAPRTSTP